MPHSTIHLPPVELSDVKLALAVKSHNALTPLCDQTTCIISECIESRKKQRDLWSVCIRPFLVPARLQMDIPESRSQPEGQCYRFYRFPVLNCSYLVQIFSIIEQWLNLTRDRPTFTKRKSSDHAYQWVEFSGNFCQKVGSRPYTCLLLWHRCTYFQGFTENVNKLSQPPRLLPIRRCDPVLKRFTHCHRRLR